MRLLRIIIIIMRLLRTFSDEESEVGGERHSKLLSLVSVVFPVTQWSLPQSQKLLNCILRGLFVTHEELMLSVSFLTKVVSILLSFLPLHSLGFHTCWNCALGQFKAEPVLVMLPPQIVD